MEVRLELGTVAHERAFLDAAKRSKELHRPWTHPPHTSIGFRNYLKHKQTLTSLTYFAFSQADELVGLVSVSEIVRGAFQSAYLGYNAFAPHHKQGYMTATLTKVIAKAFGKRVGLHRLEANIQPANAASIALVRKLGFRLEGLSPRYLKIGGRWRDHERWAITREEWVAR